MIRRIATRRALLAALLLNIALTQAAGTQSIAPPPAGITSPNDFKTVPTAKQHCGKRPVVWVIASARLYFAKGDPRYGRKGQGAYMCEDEARGDGNKRAR